MIAVAGLHNVGIPHLAAIVKAPRVKGLHHLALRNAGVQAAVGIGAGVLGVFVGQGGEAVLGLVPGQVLAENFLGLGLGICPGLVGDGGLAGGGAVYRGALRGDENMAHIHGVGVLGQALLGIVGLVGIEVLLHFLLRGSKAGIDLRVVAAGAVVQVPEGLIVRHGSPGAEVFMDHIFRGAVAVFLGGLLQAGLYGVQLILKLLGNLEAVFLGGAVYGLIHLPGGQGLLQEILLPGPVLHHAAGLAVQGLGSVHAEVGGIRAILAVEILSRQPVVDLQLSVGQHPVSGGSDHRIGSGLYLFLGAGIAALAGHIVGIAVSGDGGLGGLHSGLHSAFRGFGAGVQLLVLLLAVHHQHRHNGCHQDHGRCSQGHGRGAAHALLPLRLPGLLGGNLLSRGSFLRSSFLRRSGFLGGRSLLGKLRGSFFHGNFFRRGFHGSGLDRIFFSAGGADGLPVFHFSAAILTSFHKQIPLSSQSSPPGVHNPAQFTTFMPGMQGKHRLFTF